MLCSPSLTDVVWGGLVTPMYVRFRVMELLDGKTCSVRNDGDSPLMAISFSLCLFSTLGNLGVMSVDRYLAVAMTMAIVPQVNIFPHQVVKIFEGSFSIIFSCLIIIFQILTLVTLRKHNKAQAQVMEESARANSVTAHNTIERKLTTTTRHVVCLLGLVIIPMAFNF